jgi:hypothetical protein
MDTINPSESHQLPALAQLAIVTALNLPIGAGDGPVKIDGFKVPGTRPLHKETIKSVDHHAANNLEDILHSRCAGTGERLVIKAIGKQTRKTGFTRFLDKDVPVVCRLINGGENDGHVVAVIVSCGGNSALGVVNANNGNAAGEINALLDRFFKPQGVTGDAGVEEPFAGEVFCQAKSLVLTHVCGIEELPAEVAWLHHIRIQDDHFTDTFSHKAFTYLSANATPAYDKHFSCGQRFLAEARYPFLPVAD